MRNRLLSFGIALFVVILAGCGQEGSEPAGPRPEPEESTTHPKEVTMKLTSPEFQNGGNIPSVYTCDGKNISPPLEISDVPEDAASLALVVDDPDAPGQTFDHWIVWNISPGTTRIPGGQQPEGIPGENDFGDLSYGGPCPPSGTHTYRFKLYALDVELDLGKGSSKKQLERAMEGHVLAESLLEGNYSRQ